VEMWEGLGEILAGQGSPIVCMQGSGAFYKIMMVKTFDLLPLALVIITREGEELVWAASEVENKLVHHSEVVGGITDGAWQEEQSEFSHGDLQAAAFVRNDSSSCKLWLLNDEQGHYPNGKDAGSN